MSSIDTLIFAPSYNILGAYKVYKYMEKKEKNILLVARKKITYFILKLFLKNIELTKSAIEIERIIKYNINLEDIIFTNHNRVNIRLVRFNKFNHILLCINRTNINKSLRMYDEIWCANKNNIDKLNRYFKSVPHLKIRSFFV